ncbi:cytochrome c biogenesis CcdA family protein [Paralimibaculum aggregatum]|uniref:Cytochrome c biogenesis CcdA family protein n=1 Tax=Paralimibaculum aggregatum TaxID=3036245 RepID=A0ABQ6LIS3_9RHOB|nr:cytochrome c biogenesis protein CcdA [Limibaculum sp. NKW23]GMG82872.1 cytochrome c biogenesis CcdA family protein [Limibaculum sp. NKW23]
MEISLIGVATAFGGGVVSFLSPCVLPLAPPYLAYLGGTTLDQISGEEQEIDRATQRRVFVSACFFVAGLATVFVALGMGASAVGQTLLQNKTLLGQIAGALIIVMGLHFLHLLRLPFLNREARFAGPARAGGYGTSYVIGLAFAFGWTPCIGPILAAILTMAAQEQTLAAGTGLLAVYALGLGLPFLVAALFVGPFLRWARRFRRHMGLVEKAMGALLVAVGLMMVTGRFEQMAFWLLETFPVLGRIG